MTNNPDGLSDARAVGGAGYLASRSSFSCTASRMNLARPYVPTSWSSRSRASGGKLTCTRVWLSGGRPIGRAIAGADVRAKKIVSFSLASVNCALYINGTVYGGKAMSQENQQTRSNFDDLAGAYGRAMARYERGEISARVLGVAKRRMNSAEAKWRSAHYGF